MIRVCPKPMVWQSIHRRLLSIAEGKPELSKPPVPLILAGWAYTNDLQKMDRWSQTVSWAEEADCSDIINTLVEEEFYYTEDVSNYDIGPLGGPLFRPWDSIAKCPLDSTEKEKTLHNLKKYWPDIAPGFSGSTEPIALTGKKARRLLVLVLKDIQPPWGKWDNLSHIKEKRLKFTFFRSAVNEIIQPHEVDHIDFIFK